MVSPSAITVTGVLAPLNSPMLTMLVLREVIPVRGMPTEDILLIKSLKDWPETAS